MHQEADRAVRVAIIGAALSANKGAAGMACSVIAGLPSQLARTCEFELLTTYPKHDRAIVDDPAVRVVSLTPGALAFPNIPLAALSAVLRRLRLPHRWLLRTRALRAVSRADVVVDAAGISFVDGRGLANLGYNTLMTGLPLLLGRPVVKTAQALGPFRMRTTRAAARLVLSRLGAVCARGQSTRAHLDELELTNVVDAADLTFALPEELDLDEGLASLVEDDLGGGDFVVVMPSQVVAGLSAKASIDYVAAMADVIAGIRAKLDLPIVIAPHSYRPGDRPDRMNDGPIARQLAAACTSREVHLIDRDLPPLSLRALVDRASLLVTSRFHGMVSGLATATPTVVIGWSHKYREVMSDFRVERLGLPHTALSDPARVVELVVDASLERDELSAAMTAALPAVRLSAQRNFEAIAKVLPEGGSS